MEKFVYVVTRPTDAERDPFAEALLSDIGPAFAQALPLNTRVRIRILDAAFHDWLRGAWRPVVPYHGGELDADAILDVIVPGTDGPRESVWRDAVPLDEAHEVLARSTSTVQGWRVEATPYADTVRDPDPGVPSEYLGGGAFIRRTDGMSKARFSIEWHIHGAHAVARHEEEVPARPFRRYIQNHVVEPVTPVRWLVDGYEEVAVPREQYTAEVLAEQEPYPDEVPYDIARYGPGEAEFFRMPCIQFRGTEYVVAT